MATIIDYIWVNVSIVPFKNIYIYKWKSSTFWFTNNTTNMPGEGEQWSAFPDLQFCPGLTKPPGMSGFINCLPAHFEHGHLDLTGHRKRKQSLRRKTAELAFRPLNRSLLIFPLPKSLNSVSGLWRTSEINTKRYILRLGWWKSLPDHGLWLPHVARVQGSGTAGWGRGQRTEGRGRQTSPYHFVVLHERSLGRANVKSRVER